MPASSSTTGGRRWTSASITCGLNYDDGTIVIGSEEGEMTALTRDDGLDGKVAVISGAASGIGQALAVAYARAGQQFIGDGGLTVRWPS